MSLFGDLYVGTSGLQTSQEALNVVAHNITNTDTKGYVRQQVSQGTREYNRLNMNIDGVSQRQTGLGVFISEVRQVRDRFLDQSYREEAGRQGFYDVAYGAIQEIEEILGEMDGATFYESMNDLWTSIEELVKDPSSEVCQSMFVQYSQSFVEAAGNVYKDLANYQDKLNFRVKNDVEEINRLGKQIYELNNQIRSIEAGGIENANDYKDRRNQLIDELSEKCKISYNEDFFGNVLIKIEGHDFVQMDKVNEMAYQLEDESGFYKVYWPDTAKYNLDANGNKVYNPDSAPVFDLNLPISSAADTDLGSLKSVLLARGDHRGNWTDLETESDYNNVKDSVLMNVMAEFDGLVRNVCIAVNDVLKESNERAKADVNPNSSYLQDEYGHPLQMFQRISVDDDKTNIPDKVTADMIASGEYTVTKRTDGPGYLVTDKDGVAFNNATYYLNGNGDYIGDSSTWFGISNLKVNQDLLQYPTHLGFMLPDGSVDYVTAKAMEAKFNDKNYVLNPTLTNPISINEYYANFVAQISNSGNVYKSLKENQELTVEQVEGSRQGAIGVSTDEELSNMIKYQNAYNASSRFINVIDECIEHIISTLGS